MESKPGYTRAELRELGFQVRLLAAAGNKYELTRKDKALLKEAGSFIRQQAEALCYSNEVPDDKG